MHNTNRVAPLPPRRPRGPARTWRDGGRTLVTLLAALFAALVATMPAGAGDLSRPDIVGGTIAADGAWPSQVHLSMGCGGTVIAPRWVLTAAHCFTADDIATPATVTVLLGTNDQTGQSGGVTIAASQIIVHAGYDPVTTDNDIALVQLATATTQPVQSLVTPATARALTAPGTFATVTGWGALRASGPSPLNLYQLTIPLIDTTVCNGLPAYSNKLTVNMLCAGSLAGGQDSCQGDSGGPLVTPLVGGGWAQIGIVSWGISCAQAQTPGIYTNLANYAGWIQSRVPDAVFVTTTDPAPQSGLWWSGTLTGTSYLIDARGRQLRLVIVTRNDDGTAPWYMASGTLNGATVTADLLDYGAAGGPAKVATVSLTFSDPVTARIALQPTGSSFKPPAYDLAPRALTRVGQVLPNYGPAGLQQGLWWDPAYPGIGYFINEQDAVLSVLLLGYGSDSRARWYSLSGETLFVAPAAGYSEILTRNLIDRATGEAVMQASLLAISPGSATLRLADGTVRHLVPFNPT